MSEKANKQISKIISDLFNQMGLKEIKVDCLDSNDTVIFNIQTQNPSDSSLLIGRRGESLASLQHLIYILVQKQIIDIPNFMIDINNYRQDRKSRLIDIAKFSAEKVIKSGRPETLKPMNSYQRKMIHIALDGYDKITTESIGVEPDRKVLIKLKN